MNSNSYKCKRLLENKTNNQKNKIILKKSIKNNIVIIN